MAIIVGVVGGITSITLPLVYALIRLEHRLTHIEATIAARWPVHRVKVDP